MLIHLCELLVIVILLAMLGIRRKGASSFHANPFNGPGPYRGDSTRAQLENAQTRVKELERALGKAKREARWRSRIIYLLWRRNASERLGRLYWWLLERKSRALARIPWPSNQTCGIVISLAASTLVLWGVLGLCPHHAGTPPRARVRTEPRFEPTMIPIQVTWGGEVAIQPIPAAWLRGWACHEDIRPHLLVQGRYPICEADFDFKGPLLMPAFLFHDNDWLRWVSQPPRTLNYILD